MTARTFPALFLVLLLGTAAAPAGADDAAAIKAHLRAAAATVTSVVIDFEMSGPFPIAMTITSASGRAKAMTVAGGIRVESYSLDGMLYMHTIPGDSWRKMAIAGQQLPTRVIDALRAAYDETLSVLPDRQEDGATVGVIQLKAPVPAPAGTAAVGPPAQFTCSYDKASFHLRSCANARMSMTFSKYNDPSNTVALPPEAAGAVLIKTHSSGAEPVTSPAPAAPDAPDATAAPTPAAPTPAAPTAPLPTSAPSPSAQPS